MQQQKNNTEEKQKFPWYRAPIVWLGALILLMTCYGFYHLLSLTHQLAADNPLPETEQTTGNITHIFGVPLNDSAKTQGNDDNDEQ